MDNELIVRRLRGGREVRILLEAGVLCIDDRIVAASRSDVLAMRRCSGAARLILQELGGPRQPGRVAVPQDGGQTIHYTDARRFAAIETARERKRIATTEMAGTKRSRARCGHTASASNLPDAPFPRSSGGVGPNCTTEFPDVRRN